MPLPPSHIMALSLKSAKLQVLKSWISAANAVAGITNRKDKCYMARTGTVSKLCA